MMAVRFRSAHSWFPRLVAAGLGLLCLLGVAAAQASATRAEQLIGAALQLDGDVTRGEVVYAAQCASCHGKAASGDPARVIPALAGQRAAYVIKQLADFTEFERESRDMHDVVDRAAIAKPQVWADIGAYLGRLPPARFTEHGDGSGLRLGAAMYREQCTSCHGDDARGNDEEFVPSLRGQHYTYLLRQMRSIATWHRLHVEDNLIRFLDSLNTDELTALADFLSRQQGPAPHSLSPPDTGGRGP
jgi:cytochrome c553